MSNIINVRLIKHLVDTQAMTN